MSDAAFVILLMAVVAAIVWPMVAIVLLALPMMLLATLFLAIHAALQSLLASMGMAGRWLRLFVTVYFQRRRL